MKVSKRIFLIFFPIFVFSIIYAETSIDKNKDRITEINKQLNKNNQIKQNNNKKISSAKKSESSIKREINNLNYTINKLKREYKELEQKYIKIQKEIGRNEADIKQSIRAIKKSENKISEENNNYQERVKALDKIRKASMIRNEFETNTANNNKRKQDAKKVLELQATNIQSIKYYKKTVEGNKKTVEKIKEKNINEAQNVKNARIALENKEKEIEKTIKLKDAKVSELRNLQASLGAENKKIDTTNSKLISEKRRLEAQIQAIIAKSRKGQDSSKHDDGTPVVVIKGTGRLAMPVRGNIVVAFGQEKVKGLKSNGIEIRGRLGQNVQAADTGTVIHAGKLGSLGGIVIIDHSGIITVYGNLATVNVKKRQNVQKGETIGTLGRDSATKETNLYFETRKGVNLVNPINYL